MSYSMADEYDRRMRAHRIEYQRRAAYWTRTAKAAPKYPRMTSKDEGDYAWRN